MFINGDFLLKKKKKKKKIASDRSADSIMTHTRSTRSKMMTLFVRTQLTSHFSFSKSKGRPRWYKHSGRFFYMIWILAPISSLAKTDPGVISSCFLFWVIVWCSAADLLRMHSLLPSTLYPVDLCCMIIWDRTFCGFTATQYIMATCPWWRGGSVFYIIQLFPLYPLYF